MTVIVGIDPGIEGAVACLDFNAAGTVLGCNVWDMPTLRHKVGQQMRRRVDPGAMWAIAQHVAQADAYIFEDPNARPTDGVVQAFSFGYGCGVVQASLHAAGAAFDVPMLFVKPSTWKKAMRLSSDKRQSVAMIRTMLPQWAHLFPTAKDGRAEAALLAVYGLVTGRF